MKTKICIKCKEEKALSEFNVDKRGKNCRNPRCRDCINSYRRQRYAQNPGKDKASPESIKMYSKNYRENNRSKISTYNQKYETKNRKHLNTKTREAYHKRTGITNIFQFLQIQTVLKERTA